MEGVAGGELPAGKILVPGVISHGTNVVEHPELVAERLTRFASCVGRENLIAGTDCGFAQEELNRRVHPTVMWAKLEAMVEGSANRQPAAVGRPGFRLAPPRDATQSVRSMRGHGRRNS